MPLVERDMPERWKGIKAKSHGGDPPGDNDTEHRLTALETRLDTVLPTLSTKGDVEAVRADISRWMLATLLTIIGAMLAAVFGVAQIFKGQQQPAPQSQPPVIINVPTPQQQHVPLPPQQEKRR